MVDRSIYIENPANKHMHYGDKPIVGIVDFPDYLPIKRPYNYFDAQNLYSTLQYDIWDGQNQANPEKTKKGIPKLIKILAGIILSASLVFGGVKGINKLVSKFKH